MFLTFCHAAGVDMNMCAHHIPYIDFLVCFLYSDNGVDMRRACYHSLDVCITRHQRKQKNFSKSDMNSITGRRNILMVRRKGHKEVVL